jgi:hypothetical protein
MPKQLETPLPLSRLQRENRDQADDDSQRPNERPGDKQKSIKHLFPFGADLRPVAYR